MPLSPPLSYLPPKQTAMGRFFSLPELTLPTPNFGPPFYEELNRFLSNANYHLAISIMSDSDLKQLNFPQTISDSSIKGIILVEICDKVVCDALSQFNLPIVSVDMPNVPFEELNGIDVVTMESKKNLKKK